MTTEIDCLQMKTQWEHDLVEEPFCQQLQLKGWQWLESDAEVPEFTGRAN